MKKILIFVIALAMSVAHAGAAVRDGNSIGRSATQKRISTTPTTERTTSTRPTTILTGRGTTSRTAIPAKSTDVRTNGNVINRSSTNNTKQTSTNVLSRAATTGITSETRTGAVYETCKTAFFTCMDQFCTLKNDDYRRCSCSSRVDSMDKQRAALNDAGEQLTVFTENLDVVGLTKAQATAMRTASEGENALSKDTSASKALLQAIMNSLTGNDTTVSGKYSDLNTLNVSYDLSTVFSTDANQIVASYNGQDLYTAVYARCRHAVADDCNNASLQRAVNAYLMAIEQDCNTVQTAIDERQAQMKSAIREGSAMLDLARVENRRKHNSDDITTCINNVENAILSEEVCGANYHKCLDNGEFIDQTTGAPIVGVIKFYELGELLTFDPSVDAANQQLSKRASNRTFVQRFESRTKKFAEPALDKCTEIADDVWSAYLDKAMLTIHYAQQAKVSKIKQGCLDFVSQCYTDSDMSITTAMSEIIGSGQTLLKPDQIALTTQMCTDYVESCNNMFGENNLITNYVNNRQGADTLTACRAVVKQCFDKYGGTRYENFYYPYSGLFDSTATAKSAGDWFTLYDLTDQDMLTWVSGDKKTENPNIKYLSPCAKQLAKIDACNEPETIETAFGGFDAMMTQKGENQDDQLSFFVSNNTSTNTTDGDDNGGENSAEGDTTPTSTKRYGMLLKKTSEEEQLVMQNRVLRPVGVATEVYNQVIDTLSVQCSNINGRFVERQFIKEDIYGGRNKNNICLWYPQQTQNTNNYKAYINIANAYGIFLGGNDDPDNPVVPSEFRGENMCPRDYNLNVAVDFWGACLCWENGARRSRNGKNATCVAELPAKASNNTDTTTSEVINGNSCYNDGTWYGLSDATTTKFNSWCVQGVNSSRQVCPHGFTPHDIPDEANSYYYCLKTDGSGLFNFMNLIPPSNSQ